MNSSVDALLAGYNMRPHRGEALYELVRHYRQAGLYETAIDLAEIGRLLPWPDDLLMIETLPYRWGFRAELATLGCHSKRSYMYDQGYRHCEAIALDRAFPVAPRERAWCNLFNYTKLLSDYAPSFMKEKIEFPGPNGFSPMNPSILNYRGSMIMVVRYLNHGFTPPGAPKPKDPCVTRNFLFWVDRDISRQTLVGEISMPADFPVLYQEVQGLEDMRLWPFEGDLCFSATSRQHNEKGWIEIVSGKILSEAGSVKTDEWQVMPKPVGVPAERPEKNWMPFADGSGRFIYRCDPMQVYSPDYGWQVPFDPHIAAHHWCGSTQVIPFDEGYLCMVHERPADLDPVLGKPPYRQRFVWFDAGLQIRKISWGFEFGHQSAGEYVCGMCMHPDGERLTLAYGVLDAQAFLATVNADEVRSLLRDV